MEENTLEVTERSEVFEFTSLREMVNQTLHQNFGENTVFNGLSSGFTDIDKVISGFKKGELITIGVNAGMGKTAFMLSLANNIAIKNKHSIAIFSPERSSAKITNRLIESETGMSLSKLKNGKLNPREKDHMISLVSNIAKSNVYLDDTPNIFADELMKKARQLKINQNIELIIIDYLELLGAHAFEADSREEQLSTIVHQIKDIARELNIPVVLFSQIPGNFNGFGSPRPSLKNIPVFLAELSDVVMFVHRTDLFPGTSNGDSGQENLVDVIIGKFEEHNQEVVVPVRFIESLAKFTDF
ncbi:MAG: replicative DNA helicase [bacterium]